MKQLKWMKLWIGCLVIMMMLGAASFSFQALAGTFQPVSSPQYTANTSNPAVSDNNCREESSKPAGSDLSKSVDPAAHSMNSRPETSGFLAVPWISVSYIRQSVKEAVFQQGRKLLRTFTIIDYPSCQTISVTDRTIRNQTNSGFLTQALTFHISKLTAG